MANVPPSSMFTKAVLGTPGQLPPGHLPSHGQIPPAQLPPGQVPTGYSQPQPNHRGQYVNHPPTQPPFGLNDANTNSPQHATSQYNNVPPQMAPPGYANNLGAHSLNSSPAFNKPALAPTSQQLNYQSSPNRTPAQNIGPSENKMPLNVVPPNSLAQTGPVRPAVSYSGAIPTSSSNLNKFPLGSPTPVKPLPNQIQPQPTYNQPQPTYSQSQPVQQINPNMPPLVQSSQPLRTYSSTPQSMLNGPSMPINTPVTGPPQSINRTNNLPPTSQPYGQQINSGISVQPSLNGSGLPIGPSGQTYPKPQMSRPPIGSPGGPPMGGLQTGPTTIQLPRPPMSGPGPMNGPQAGFMNGPPIAPMNGPPSGLQGGPPAPTGPTGLPSGPSGLQSGPTNAPINSMYQAAGSSQTMNSRYPPNVPPQTNYNNPMQQQQGQNPNQYNGPQNLTNQMGQMNITKSGFNQMWGQQMFDLLQQRHILPEYPEDPPEIRLGNQFAESVNCSPEIFRCTINRIPETNSLLQKSRLPLGILIHPFKDLNHLPVIQCTSIVRCRMCRTYINPFVYFVDSKRWKCNLCYRVNDLPEEFQYDPVSKSYGDPTRRPEIKSATIEFIAPGEYMLRPPQPAIYLFLLDISQIARESGYLQVFCETLKQNIEQLPGDARTQVGFICYDTNVHFYLMGDGLTRPREMTVIDIDDVFLPSPECLLVNLVERREMVLDLLDVLPKRHSGQGVPASALGSALQAAYKLMAPTGGRITVLQTCLPNVGPGALISREDPNARSSKDVAHLNPATDFYKRLALDCSGAQVAVDLFLINSQYADLATLSGMSKFSGGSVYHIPLFKISRPWQADQLRRMLSRYLTRKIGFEAVMRVRCTKGIGIHTFHGNFFVRSTDLLSLPNVSPDAGFGMQLTIEESLSDLQQVCFQAALLYTSSKGERRIRVHTMCLPVANNLTDVLHSADQQCIIGLLTKMAVDRCQQSSLNDAREALINVAVDTLSAHRLAQNLPSSAMSASLQAPACLRLLPLYLSGLLKHPAFRTGTSTRLDDRVAAMCNMKSLPLYQLMRSVYPDLYPIHNLEDYLQHQPQQRDAEEEAYPDPPKLHLTAEQINSNGAYLLDDGESMIIYIGSAVSPTYLQETFGVASFQQVPDEAREIPHHETTASLLLHSFVEKLNDDRPYVSNVLILRDNSPVRQLFTGRLVDDRMESAFSYYEFLQHIKSLMK